jgi:hypothetical protein
MTNIWMPFHRRPDVTNEQVEVKYEGCSNIFDNYVVTPHGHLMSCCGLTMEYIDELRIGHIDTHDLLTTYNEQYRDLLKLWIWLDGTRFIFDEAAARGVSAELLSPHPCSVCAQIYQDPAVRQEVRKMVLENAEQIVFRATLKLRMRSRPDTPARPRSGSSFGLEEPSEGGNNGS